MTNWKVVRMRPSTRGVKWSLSWYTSLCWGVACSAWRRIRRKEKSFVMMLYVDCSVFVGFFIDNYTQFLKISGLISSFYSIFKWFNTSVYFPALKLFINWVNWVDIVDIFNKFLPPLVCEKLI